MYVGETDNFFVRIEDHIGDEYLERCNAAGREVDFVLFAGCNNAMLRDVALRECRFEYEGRLFYLLVSRFSWEYRHMPMKIKGLHSGRTD